MYTGHALTLLATVTVYIIIVQLINRVTSLRWLATKQKVLLYIFKIPCGSRVVHFLTSSDVRMSAFHPYFYTRSPEWSWSRKSVWLCMSTARHKNILARPRNPAPPPEIKRCLPPPPPWHPLQGQRRKSRPPNTCCLSGTSASTNISGQRALSPWRNVIMVSQWARLPTRQTRYGMISLP